MIFIIALTLLFIGLTGYVYIGYFIVLSLIQRFYRSHEAPSQTPLPTVSLIIAAYNEADVIAKKLDNSQQLDYPADKLQVMVVADGSDDETAAIAQRYADQGVTVLFSPERRGKSDALNRGVAQATGEILVFSDANAYYYPQALQNLVRHFADPRVGCVSGRKTVHDSQSQIAQSEGLYWKYESRLKQLETNTGSTVGVVGEMNAIRKQLFEPIPKHVINDDSYLALRILSQGYRVVYEPEAISWETSAATTADEITRRQRINAGRYQQLFDITLWKRIPAFNLFKLMSHKFARLLLPFFMIAAFVFNAMLLGFSKVPTVMRLLFWGQVAAYTAAFAGFLLEKVNKKNKILSAAYYIVSSNVAALKGFWRFVTGQQTVLWEKARRARSDDA